MQASEEMDYDFKTIAQINLDGCFPGTWFGHSTDNEKELKY